MTTYAIRNEYDRKQAIRALENRALPCTVEITKGAPRSVEQNRLQRLWLKEAEEQGDQTAEEYRAWCKLHLGVPVLRYENDTWREEYDRLIKPLPYEHKLALMAEPFDFPVTRKMSSRAKKKYLDAMYNHFTGMGFRMTDPDVLGVELDERKKAQREAA